MWRDFVKCVKKELHIYGYSIFKMLFISRFSLIHYNQNTQPERRLLIYEYILYRQISTSVGLAEHWPCTTVVPMAYGLNSL